MLTQLIANLLHQSSRISDTFGSKGQKDSELARLNKIASDRDNASRKRKAAELGYELDDQLSDDMALVAKKNGRAVVAFRGTDPNDTTDIASDINIAVMNKTNDPKFKKGLEKVRQVNQKYGKSTKLTGYSLGGAIANHANQHLGNDAVLFNPGSNPYIKEKVNKNVRVWRNKNDTISAGYGSFDGDLKMGVFNLATGAHRLEQFF